MGKLLSLSLLFPTLTQKVNIRELQFVLVSMMTQTNLVPTHVGKTFMD